jgi:molybdate transport system substrate-binding protein
MKTLRWLLLPIALAGLLWLLFPTGPGGANAPLVCHVGGTMTPLFLDLAAAYRDQGGAAVSITSAGSGELMATIELQHHGDLYVCHDPFMDRLMARGLGINAWRLAELKPVLIIAKGNPKQITGLKDLYRDDVRVMLTNREHSTLGNMLPIIFQRAGLDLDALFRDKQVDTHRSGSHVANLLIMDACDAALVWQVVAHLRADEVDVIRIDPHLPRPGIDTITSATGKEYPVAPVRVTITRLACSTQAAVAEDFVRFTLSDAGMALVRQHGYAVDFTAGHPEYVNGIANPHILLEE